MSTRREESHLDPSHDIPYSAEVKRKALHLLALIVPFLMGVLGKNLSVAILLPMSLISVGADALRAQVFETFDMSLGTGLNKLATKAFRIGHLGFVSKEDVVEAFDVVGHDWT